MMAGRGRKRRSNSPKQRKPGVLGRLMLVINLLIAGLLLSTYLAPWIDPKLFWPIALLGIAYLPLLIINLVFVLGWLLVRPAYALLSLLSIGIGWNALPAHVGTRWSNTDTELSPRAAPPSPSGTRDTISPLRILSYNVHLFRSREQTSRAPAIKAAAIELIASVSPDVVCVQEYYTRQKGEHDIARSFRQELGLMHQYVHAVAKNNFESYGMAIFSKYPILRSGRIAEFEQGVNSIIFADIEKEGQVFRVYNVHLRSYGFQKEDYDFIKSPTGSLETHMSSTKRIGSRMKHAFAIRSQQARSLRLHAEKAETPYLITGDFNDTPLSFAVNHVGRGLQNAFKEKGRGWGVTYNGDFPNFQIDYILASPEFRVQRFEIVKRKLSDHYPVWADMSLR